MQKYQRVALSDRIQIEACLASGLKISEIAKNLGLHKTTIYREIKRNKNFDRYGALEADERASIRVQSCRRSYKLKGMLLQFTLSKLKVGWTPDQVSNRLKQESSQYRISQQTIYRMVKRLDLEPTHLRFGYKRKGFGRTHQRRWSRESDWKLSIHDRPMEAELRLEIGHWERDLFCAKDKRTVLTLTDRKSRFTIFRKNPNFKSQEVAKLTNKIMRERNLTVKTITNDNGSEFFDVKAIKAPVYFCDVKSPGQRGTVENTIGLMRRFIKKGTDLNKISYQKLQALEDQINLRPRKCLDYKTPYEVFYNKKVALAV